MVAGGSNRLSFIMLTFTMYDEIFNLALTLGKSDFAILPLLLLWLM